MTETIQPARDLARIVDAARRMGVELDEAEIVRTLVQLREQLENGDHGAGLSTDAEAARSLLKNLVNTFFHDRLVAVPTIDAYIGRLQAEFAEDAAAR
jgi:hypothetical protein